MRPHERAATKVCKACKQTKQITDFSSGKRTCKKCRCAIEAQRYRQPEFNARHAINRARYYAENRQQILRQKSEYGRRLEVADRDKARRRNRRLVDPVFKARELRRFKRYYEANKHVHAAKSARQRADRLRATPPWADLQAIRRFYLEARRLTKITGIPHEVDHIVPLKGENVSGLHVENNLRVIPMVQNRRKANKLVEDIVQTT